MNQSPELSPIPRLAPDRAALLVVDIQQAFVQPIAEMPRVIDRTRIMIEAAKLLQLPILVTEQYPRGLGRTVETLQNVLEPCHYYEKVDFSCFQDGPTREALQATGCDQILLVGIEAHVCIAQTALDLLAVGYQPFIAVDALASQRQTDMDVALQRMASHGVILTTTEAAIMEMTVSSKHPQFRAISKLLKS